MSADTSTEASHPPQVMTGATMVDSVTMATFPVGYRLTAHAPGHLGAVLATLDNAGDAYYVLGSIEGAMDAAGGPIRLSAVRRIVRAARRDLADDRQLAAEIAADDAAEALAREVERCERVMADPDEYGARTVAEAADFLASRRG